MLDIKFIREQPDSVKEGVKKKGEDPSRVDEALRFDEQRRQLLQKGETLKSRKNTVSAEVAKMKSKGEDAGAVIAEMKSVADDIKKIDDDLKSIEEQLRAILLQIPNIPHSSVPVGKTPAENQVISTWGETPVVDFPMKPHWELVEKLNIIDFARGVKITGAGFPVYVGKGAQLERALINFFLDQASANGYTEILPPFMVNSASATGTGQLPDKEDQMYVATKDEFYLVPTAEVPVTNFFRNERKPDHKECVREQRGGIQSAGVQSSLQRVDCAPDEVRLCNSKQVAADDSQQPPEQCFLMPCKIWSEPQ